VAISPRHPSCAPADARTLRDSRSGMVATVSDDQETDLRPALPRERLTRPSVLLEWAGQHAVLSPDKQALLIGASPAVDVMIEDSLVSRVHAELRYEANGPWIRDMKSRNGTYVDGVQVEGARVRDGSQLTLGETIVRVRFDQAASSVPLWPHASFGALRGGSVKMRELYRRMDLAARSDATVLVEGETGTGKELVAEAIHEASRRSGSPFAIVDCSALAPSILESELFGHARGAFTGAVAARAGVVEAAQGGTVFLDEIGEIPLSLQPKLLRLMESRTLRRVGENTARTVNVRFIAATHRSLQAMINEGTFREDLYFRISVLRLRTPPLRERTEDIPSLVQAFSDGKGIDVDLLQQLITRPWPGNVRELRNFVEYSQVFGDREALRELSPHIGAAIPSTRGTYHQQRRDCLDAFERTFVERLLHDHGGDTRAAAEAGGLDRSHLYRLIKRHRLR